MNIRFVQYPGKTKHEILKKLIDLSENGSTGVLVCHQLILRMSHGGVVNRLPLVEVIIPIRQELSFFCKLPIRILSQFVRES